MTNFKYRVSQKKYRVSDYLFFQKGTHANHNVIFLDVINTKYLDMCEVLTHMSKVTNVMNVIGDDRSSWTYYNTTN